MELKDRILKMIEDEGLTVAKFASEIGSGESSLYKIIRGESKRIQVKTAKRINAVFPKYSVNWIVKGKDDNKQSSIELGLSKDEIEMLTDVSNFIINNEKRLEQIPMFRTWITTIEQRGAIKILKEN